MEEIRIQSIRFDADQKLLDFVKKKLSKLPKFHDSVIGIDVKLSLLAEHDNKNVWVKVQVPEMMSSWKEMLQLSRMPSLTARTS